MSREDPDAALDTDAVPLEEVYGLINSLFAEDEGDVAIEVIGEDLARSVQAYNRLKSNFFKAIKQVVVKGLVKLTAAARKAKIGSPHDLILLPEVLVMLSCPDGEVKRLRSEGFKHGEIYVLRKLSVNSVAPLKLHLLNLFDLKSYLIVLLIPWGRRVLFTINSSSLRTHQRSVITISAGGRRQASRPTSSTSL